jgi:hypothetical protein
MGLRDVRVTEGELGIPDEVGDKSGVVGEVGVHDFEGDLAMKACPPMGPREVDDAPSSTADDGERLVMPDAVGNEAGGRRRAR